MRTFSLLCLLATACQGPGISDETGLDDVDTDTTNSDADGDTDTDADTVPPGGYGDPVTGAALEGATYVIDFDDIDWISPSGVGLISGQIPADYLLIHIIEADTVSQSIALMGALGVPAGSAVAQDMCQETFDFGAHDFQNNPFFSIGPSALSFPVQGTDFTIDSAYIGGTFIEDGDALRDITISGRLDTRPLDGAFNLDVCSLVSLVGDTCTACPDNVVKCLDVHLEVDRADIEEGLVFSQTVVPGPSCR